MNEMICAFDIVDALVHCDDWLKEQNIMVCYENDVIHNSAAIFVKDTVVVDKEAHFKLDVRGFKNDGRSSTHIVAALIKYHSYYQTLVIRDTLYDVRFWFSNAIGAGADEQGRAKMNLDVRVQVNVK
jgi:hypothetical protein